MAETDPQAVTYAMGRSAEETERLIRNARLRYASTRRLFEAAGITTGMRILDVGSGAGDVALLAAELVGPTGAVVSMDQNPAILATAQARAQAAGLANVTFRAADIRESPLDGPFDGVVGRFVLLYLDDPVVALRRLAAAVRPGGIVAFQEADFTVGPHAWPPSPLMEQIIRWALEVFQRTGADARMGMKLYRTFVDAGLPAPQMCLEAPVGGGPDYPGYQVMGDAMRSMLPMLVRFGIATEEEVGVETLAARLREEVVRQRGVLMNPATVGAWVQKT